MQTETPIRILLVEDDEDDYLIIKDYLSDSFLPYQITWVMNLNGFMKELEQESFDLVITDYLLGSTSGLEVLRRVKEKDIFIPVMLLTGKGNTHIDIEAMKLGAADYLVKGSFDASTIERAVRYTIERAHNARVAKENERYQQTINKIVSTDRIARMIAHEVKNPLTNILLCAEQMKEQLGENQECNSYLDIIARNSQRINQLVSNLLDSTRFGDIELKEDDLVEVIKETKLLVRDRLSLKAIKVKDEYSHPVVQIKLDKEKLKLALTNIMINAIEALDDQADAEIRIKIEKLSGQVKLSIKDNGPGISDEIKGKLFEPFFTSKEKGSGIGLPSAQNIILGHKGKIELHSERKRGAEFVITFPL